MLEITGECDNIFEGDSEYEIDPESPKDDNIFFKKHLIKAPQDFRQSPTTLQAIQFIKEFEDSKIELIATVKGYMYTTSLRAPIVDRKTGKLISRPSADPKPALKYFVLDPVHGDIIVFPKKEEYLESQVKSAMFIKMKQIVCAWGPSGRSDMVRHGIENSIELNFLNESIMLLGAYDKAQMNEWLVNLQKAKKFADWYFSIKVMIKE